LIVHLMPKPSREAAYLIVATAISMQNVERHEFIIGKISHFD
jgi:hypothetical protein